MHLLVIPNHKQNHIYKLSFNLTHSACEFHLRHKNIHARPKTHTVIFWDVQHVIWYKSINVSHKFSASIFSVYD
jgi:hypothetical protein